MTCCGLSAKNDDAAQQRIGLSSRILKIPCAMEQIFFDGTGNCFCRIE
jgi:hypothetical protein